MMDNEEFIIKDSQEQLPASVINSDDDDSDNDILGNQENDNVGDGTLNGIGSSPSQDFSVLGQMCRSHLTGTKANLSPQIVGSPLVEKHWNIPSPIQQRPIAGILNTQPDMTSTPLLLNSTMEFLPETQQDAAERQYRREAFSCLTLSGIEAAGSQHQQQMQGRPYMMGESVPSNVGNASHIDMSLVLGATPNIVDSSHQIIVNVNSSIEVKSSSSVVEVPSQAAEVSVIKATEVSEIKEAGASEIKEASADQSRNDNDNLDIPIHFDPDDPDASMLPLTCVVLASQQPGYSASVVENEQNLSSDVEIIATTTTDKGRKRQLEVTIQDPLYSEGPKYTPSGGYGQATESRFSNINSQMSVLDGLDFPVQTDQLRGKSLSSISMRLLTPSEGAPDSGQTQVRDDVTIGDKLQHEDPETENIAEDDCTQERVSQNGRAHSIDLVSEEELNSMYGGGSTAVKHVEPMVLEYEASQIIDFNKTDATAPPTTPGNVFSGQFVNSRNQFINSQSAKSPTYNSPFRQPADVENETGLKPAVPSLDDDESQEVVRMKALYDQSVSKSASNSSILTTSRLATTGRDSGSTQETQLADVLPAALAEQYIPKKTNQAARDFDQLFNEASQDWVLPKNGPSEIENDSTKRKSFEEFGEELLGSVMKPKSKTQGARLSATTSKPTVIQFYNPPKFAAKLKPIAITPFELPVMQDSQGEDPQSSNWFVNEASIYINNAAAKSTIAESRVETAQENLASGSNTACMSSKVQFKKFNIGDKVWCIWDDEFLYPADLTTVNNNEEYVVTFHDGSTRKVFSHDLVSLEIEVGDTVLAKRPNKSLYLESIVVRIANPCYLVWSLEKEGSNDRWFAGINDLCLSRNDLKNRQLNDKLMHEYAAGLASKQSTNATAHVLHLDSPVPPREASLPIAPVTATKKFPSARESARCSPAETPAKFRPRIFDGFFFLLTSLGDDDSTKKISNRITSAGGAILSDDSIDITRSKRRHGYTFLITSDKPCRTTKFFVALADGIPRVSMYWLNACLDRNEVVEFDDYLVPNGYDINEKLVPYRIAADVFKGLTLRLHKSPKGLDDRTMWKKCIELCGGKAMLRKNNKDLKDISYVISFDTGEEMQPIDCNLTVLSKDWLKQSLIAQSILPIEDYVLSHPVAEDFVETRRKSTKRKRSNR